MALGGLDEGNPQDSFGYWDDQYNQGNISEEEYQTGVSGVQSKLDTAAEEGKFRYPWESEDSYVTPYNVNQVYWGGDPAYADMFSGMAQSRMNAAGNASDYATGQMMDQYRQPQAVENQQLSDNEAMTRGWDQQGAVDLAREAAMGQSPSEAAYMMQQGLDQGMAGQSSMAGGARGAAAIAQAQGNAAANVANMQGQAFTEAGRLRAQEMAQARGLYGGLSGQMREQDQNRLQMGNDISKFNANLNDQYRLGMGNIGMGYSQIGNQWYGSAMEPYNKQAGLDQNAETARQSSYEHAQEIASGMTQAATDTRNRRIDAATVGLGTVLTGGKDD